MEVFWHKIQDKKTASFLGLGLILCFVFVGIYFLTQNTSAANPPQIITYQGKLLDNGLSATTTKDISFVLYDDPVVGSSLYTASGTLGVPLTVAIEPNSGIFSIDLGGSETNSLDPEIFKNYGSVYLEVIVGGETLSPRRQISATPYAFNAKYLDGVAASSTSPAATHIVQTDSSGNVNLNNATSTGLVVSGNSSLATTTISSSTITTANINNLVVITGLSLPNDSITDAMVYDNITASNYLSLTNWYATTTDGLDEGSVNKYWSNTLFDNRLSATTSLPNLATLSGLTTIGAPANNFYLNSSGNISTSGTLKVFGTSTLGTAVITESGALSGITGLVSMWTNDSDYLVTSTGRLIISSTATGLTYTNGTGVLSLTSDYAIPSTTVISNWDTAYGWGNHANAGYLGAAFASTTYANLALNNTFTGENSFSATTTFATTTISSSTITTANINNLVVITGLSLPNDSITDAMVYDNITASNYLSLTNWYATTTDGLDEGSVNKYWSNTLFDNRLSATTSLPNLATLSGLTTIGAPTNNFYLDSSGNLSTSGTLNIYGNTTLLGSLSATANTSSLRSIKLSSLGSAPDSTAGNIYFNSTTGQFYGYTADGNAVDLGATGSGGSNWSYDTNYGTSVITPSSTIPVWLKDAVYVSSTLITSGNVTLGDNSSDVLTVNANFGSSLLPTNNTYDLGSYGNAWKDIYASGTLRIGSTSVLDTNSLKIGTASGFDAGKFYVDSSGNVSASGTLNIYDNTTLQGSLSATSNTSSLRSIKLSSLGSAPDSTAGNIYFNSTTGQFFGYTADGTAVDLGSTGSGGTNWSYDTNYGTSVITPSSTIPVWLKSNLYASSSINISGNLDFSSSSYISFGNVRALSFNIPAASAFVGLNAGSSNLASGFDNVFIGNNSGYNNDYGDANTFIGSGSGLNNTGGGSNVFLGYTAGSTNVSGNGNTYLGSGSGYEGTGSFNTFVGTSAGLHNTGSYNIFLGNSAGYNETGSNKLYIANSDTAFPLIYGDFSTPALTINGNLTATGTFSATSNTSSLRSIKLSSLGSAPDSTAGNLYFNSSDGKFYGYTADGNAVDLGATGSGGSNWSYDTNYGTSVITPSSTIPVWFKDAVYASSSVKIGGNTTAGLSNLTITAGPADSGNSLFDIKDYTGNSLLSFATSTDFFGGTFLSIGNNLSNNGAGVLILNGDASNNDGFLGFTDPASNSYLKAYLGGDELGGFELTMGDSNTTSSYSWDGIRLGGTYDGPDPLDTGKFFVDAASGNVSASGTLQVFSTSSLNSVKLSSLTSAPDSTAGNLYFNSSDGKFYGYTADGNAIDLGATGSGSTNWSFDTNYGTSVLTPSTTIPVWLKDAVYASSSLIVSDNVTLGNSTTEDVVSINAKVGINSSTPSELLTIAGGNILHTASGDPILKGGIGSDTVYDVYVSGKYAYTGGSSGLQIIDISNPASPSLVGSYTTASSALKVYVSGKYAYVAEGDAGLQIMDISNPASPSLVGTYDAPPSDSINGVYVSGKYAYVSINSYGLQIIDISNPSLPNLVGSKYLGGTSYVYVSGKYAYIGSNDLFIVDISDVTNPTLEGTYSDFIESRGAYVSGKYAYIACTNEGLYIVDISSSTAPGYVGSYDTDGFANDVYVSGKYAYVADYFWGLKMIEISDPTNPILVGTGTVSNAILNVFISGKYAYTGNDVSGLQIIDINGLETPAMYAGNIQSNALTITENVDVGNNVYIRNALNVGSGGIMTDGNLSINNTSTASYIGGSLGIGTTTPWALFDVINKLTADSSGNLSASGTLNIYGNTTLLDSLSATSNTSSLRSLKLSSLGSAPDTTAGNIYFNSTTGQFYGYTSDGVAVDFGGASSGGSNWSYDTNYGTSVITPSSTIPVWLKSGVYVSSTLITSGNVTLGDTSADVLTINANIGSSLLPSVNNNYDLGSYGNAWKDIYASGTLRIGSTSILDTNSLKIGTASGFDAGKFYVNSAGNVSTSGTLHTYGSTVLDGNVSIGTTTLDYTLTVDGNIAIAGGSLFIDESRTLSGSYNNQNIFVGPAAGLNSTGNDNVFVGYVSGFNNSGVGNAFLGSTVGSDNTGDYNTYFGMNSGYANTSGGNNVFLGAFTGRLNQTGSQNVYVGRGSGWSATSSVGNVFLGYQAGYSETGSNKLYIDNSNTAYPLIYGDFSSADLTVNGNLTATGTFSATSNTSSLRSVKLSSLGSAPDTTAGNIYFNSTTGQFYGYTANGTAVDLGATGSGGSNWSYDTNYGTSVITPSSTIPVWLKSNLYVSSSINVSGALNLPTTDASGNGVVNINGVRFMHAAGGNTFLGRYAGNLSTIGVRNVGLGYSALPSVTGDGNVAVGASALSNTVDGSYNVAIGDWALYNNSAGSANVIIGYQAGGGNIAGSGNIFVGNQAGYSETGSNKLYIANSNTASPLIYGDFASAAITINGNLTATGTFSATSNTSSLRSLKLSSLGSAPDTTAGNIYFNSTTGQFFGYTADGTAVDLGSTGSGGSNWSYDTNYGTSVLTPSTTIPVWLKSNLYTSSTIITSMPASTGGTHDYAQKWYDNSGDLIASLSTTTQSYVLPQGNSVGVQDYATLEIGSTLHPGLINILGNGSLAISNPSTNLNALLSVNSLSLSNALGVTSTFANDQIELYASDANPVGVFNVNTNGDISASGTLHVYGQATFDSGITLGGVSRTTWPSTSSSDWGRFGTTYGVSALMTSTTYPVWFDGALYASSSLITSGNVTLGDSSSDIVYVSGKLGINSSTPAESLTVVGGNILQTASGNPTPKGSYSSSEASGVYVSGKYAYLADGANGLKIIDITNPAGPVLVGSIDTSGAVGVYVSGKYAYVADANPGGLKIIDVSDPGAPRLMSTYLPDGGGNISNVYVSGKYAYLADGMYGLRIVDISNPFKPILVGGDGGIATASDVYVSGKYAYVVGGTYILHIFDVSDPANPVQIDPGALSGAASYSIYVSGKYAYVANFTDGLSIVDISSSTNPVIMDSFATVASIFEVYVSGKYAYVGTINSGLQIVDISSSTNAVSVGFYNVGGASIIGVHISGKYAYTAYGANGLQIFDINGLETPALYAGNMQTNALTITESLDIGNNLYVRSGLNVGIGGIMTDGNLSINSTSTASYFGGSVGIGTTTPWATFDINHKLAIDSSGNVFASGTLGVFGNVGIGKIASTTAPIDTASGAYLSAGGSWTNSSNRNLKENFTEIDSADILNKINELVVSRWNYKAEASSTLHIGPVAQDFYSLFGLGDSTSISTIDPAGVSLLGIQELSKKLAELTSTTLDIKTTLNSQQILAPVDNSLQNYLVLNVESIRNLNNNWYIDNEGYFVTQLETSEGTKEMFGLQSPQAEFVFSSSSVLIDGEAEIIFETSEQEIIDPESSIKVTVTLTSGEASGIYVSEKSLTGFKVKELQGGTSNATFDWIVVAKRRTTDFVNTNNTDVVGDETVTTTENDNTEITTDTTTSTDNTTSTPEIPPAEEPVPTAEPEIVPPTEESVPTAEPEIVPPVEEPVLEPVVDNTPQVEEPMPVAESITEPAQ